jgi:hypothetical protein
MPEQDDRWHRPSAAKLKQTRADCAQHEPCAHVTEPLISRPARPWISGAGGMLLVAATAGADSRPARAQVADCITEPNAQAPAGTQWIPHWEINNYRRCWVLQDAAGREVVAPVPARPTATPQASSAGSEEASPRKPHTAHPDGPHRVVTAGKPALSEPTKSQVRPVKRGMGQPDRDALFEEFLRWQESQKITGVK